MIFDWAIRVDGVQTPVRDGAPVATFEGWRCRVPGGTWRWQAQGGPAHVTVGIGPVDAGIPG